MWWVGQHVFLTWISTFLMLWEFFLLSKYLDLMHRCAQHLGRWQKAEVRHAHVPYNPWSELQVWPHGALVKHVRGLFKAEGISVTAAEPGNNEIFMPKSESDIEGGELDEFEKEIGEFKRFCADSSIHGKCEKLQVSVNIKDIFSKKKNGLTCT